MEDILTMMLVQVMDSLARGQAIELRNFGSFRPKFRRERIGRNPRRPEQTAPIAAHIAVKFKEGKELRAKMSKLVTIPIETDGL